MWFIKRIERKKHALERAGGQSAYQELMDWMRDEIQRLATESMEDERRDNE